MKTTKNRRKTDSRTPIIYAYSGELIYVETEDLIEVTRLIVRGDQIAFDLVTTWGLGARWAYFGSARIQSDGTYQVANLIGKELVGQNREGDSVPCAITFKIGKQSERQVQISGIWFEGGDKYVFSGTLKKFSPLRR